MTLFHGFMYLFIYLFKYLFTLFYRANFGMLMKSFFDVLETVTDTEIDLAVLYVSITL